MENQNPSPTTGNGGITWTTPNHDAAPMGIAWTVQELDAAPMGVVAVDKDLLLYAKPFSSSNIWLLTGFADRFTASDIRLPARLYTVSPQGELLPLTSEKSSS